MPNKYLYILVIQGYYTRGYGWEDLFEYEDQSLASQRQARADLKEYRLAEPYASHRIIRRRVPNPDFIYHNLEYLKSLPTLATGQADDLKIEEEYTRVWLSRCTVADGEPYNNKVTVERLINGQWIESETFQAK